MNKVTAKEGYIFVKDGRIIGKTLYLASGDDASNYEEVLEDTDAPETDYERVLAVQKMVRSVQNEINTRSLSNSEALKVKEFYPEWEEGIDVNKGEKYNCDDDLWEALTTHKTQANWRPSLATASIWKHIDEEHEGTEDDPIPYAPPMELFNGKYYIQDEIKYRCTRDSGIPLSQNLNELIGLYVELV